jgi:lipoyl(octanoyl) transferase
MGEAIRVRDLGLMPYRQAWELQEREHERVVAGGAEAIFIVQHPPVITLGRREDSVRNLLTPQEDLSRLGVELVRSDRGGDITFHGPGQIVAYPIVRLADHNLSVGGYVHLLEKIVIAALAELGITGQTDPKAIGVWVQDEGQMAKICAIGVRIRRGVSLHGVALNVSTDLSGFSHIVPCGLAEWGVTSVAKILRDNSPTIEKMKQILISHLGNAFQEPGRAGPVDIAPSPKN